MPPPTLGLEADVAPGRSRSFEQFLSVFGQQRLVGGHHMLAGAQGFQQERACRLIAAHQFDHDVDLGIVNNGQRIARYLSSRQRRLAGTFRVAPVRRALSTGARPAFALSNRLVA